MYQIDAQTFQNFMNILNLLVDVDDIIVKNKKVSINTNSDHTLVVDLQKLDIPESAEFELLQFNQIYETLRILTNFEQDVEYGINDTDVIFMFPQGKFQFSRGIIQNKWVENPESDIPENQHLFDLELSADTFTKIAKLLAFYKADPVLTVKDGKLIISIEPKSGDRTIDVIVNDQNLFAEAGISDTPKLELSSRLFLYSPDDGINLRFFRDEYGYKVAGYFSLLESPVTYIFITNESAEIDFTNIDDLSTMLSV